MNKRAEQVKKINKELNLFNEIDDAPTSGSGKLKDIAVSVKDCICVKDMESRAGSAILEGYKPVFDATVIEKIRKEGAAIIGKTAQDAFGFGSFSVNVGKGMHIPKNPVDKTRSCGGSSGGAAGITKAADFPHIALAESTGGSIVGPASFCGVIGFCPTYGRVSRYGLMDYANSLDKIGPMAKTMEEIALMMEIIAGYDDKDSTSLDEPVPDYTKALNKSIKGLRVGILKNSFGQGVDIQVAEKVADGIQKLEDQGALLQDIKLPITEKYGVACYYLIAMAEASTNLAKYSGLRYGKQEKIDGTFNEYFKNTRAIFNDESKRRIIIGTFVRMAGFRDAYYIKATKVRTKIIDEYKKAFKKVDVLVSPTMPFVAPKFSEIKKLTPMQHYMADIMTVGPNLAGLPHISIPVGNNKENLPVGMLLIADHLKEETLMQVGNKL
ncbi:MAG: amidase family protein [Nanoarchaeota archaeon]|nr:amidase family protein [Nanoarchaeota archaeon]